MNLDRNTIIGFVLMGLLLVGYFVFTSKEQQAAQKERRRQDSILAAQKKQMPVDTSANTSTTTLTGDSVQGKDGPYQQAPQGTEEVFIVETAISRIAFTTKGGQPKYVELKNFKNQDSGLVQLAGTDFNGVNYKINAGSRSLDITDLYFQQVSRSVNADGDSVISMSLMPDSSGRSITHEFVVKQSDYRIGFHIKLKGVDQLLIGGVMNLAWQYEAVQQESDISFEKQNSQIGYVTDGEFDYHTIGRRNDKKFSDPVKWVGVRQRFFNTILMADDQFSGGSINWTIPDDSARVVVRATTDLQLEVKGQKDADIGLGIFYGPADYRILREYDQQMGKLVNLGQGIYSFVRPINKGIVYPVFDFLNSKVGSMGIAILLLTVVIRLLTSPLMYPGYKTSAQMKLLRPDLAKLKEKYPDQQQYAMEQMKFMREAGVNQFAGCLPGLLQIPIFFALYSFFNANVDLRGESFLWADDLSAFDKVIQFGTHIPLLGDHLSLFTITAVTTSFLISLYSMSSTPDQGNPMLKYMPYFFPVILLFVFNRLPSALTWYYTVSNVITLILQFVIQRFIIDHDKILAKIEENRKKPKTKSKWQERMEQMQETQKKLKDMQQKQKR